MMIKPTNFKQLKDGVVYTKQLGQYIVVSNLVKIPNNSLLYIRNNGKVSIYRINKLFAIQSINVGFGITNPWSGNVTQSDINTLITASKKLAVLIQRGIAASKKMQKADEKSFFHTVLMGVGIVLLAIVTVGVAAYLAPAAAVSATTGSTAATSVGLTTGAQYAGIAGAPSAIGAPITSSLFAAGGSVLPSAGAGVGIITSGGTTILPTVAAAGSTSSTGLSVISHIGKVLGISSIKQAAVKTAVMGGKLYISSQQQKQQQEMAEQYQQAITNRNNLQAEAIKQKYQNQLDSILSRLHQQEQSGTEETAPTVWGTTESSAAILDLKKYLPYIIGITVLVLIVKH